MPCSTRPVTVARRALTVLNVREPVIAAISSYGSGRTPQQPPDRYPSEVVDMQDIRRTAQQTYSSIRRAASLGDAPDDPGPKDCADWSLAE